MNRKRRILSLLAGVALALRRQRNPAAATTCAGTRRTVAARMSGGTYDSTARSANLMLTRHVISAAAA